ncbi:hypothetical protein QBC39DRAFT_348219 [Podospora conica]|nr:hypothetical protein QBC39DRAFT_348219 [Schizothecium conicum]
MDHSRRFQKQTSLKLLKQASSTSTTTSQNKPSISRRTISSKPSTPKTHIGTRHGPHHAIPPASPHPNPTPIHPSKPPPPPPTPPRGRKACIPSTASGSTPAPGPPNHTQEGRPPPPPSPQQGSLQPHFMTPTNPTLTLFRRLLLTTTRTTTPGRITNTRRHTPSRPLLTPTNTTAMPSSASSNPTQTSSDPASTPPPPSSTSHPASTNPPPTALPALPALPAVPDAAATGENAPQVLRVDGAAVVLDHLGPMVIGRDGTVSRIANWGEMADIERENTLRVLGRRNQIRLAALRGEDGKTASPDAGGEKKE